MEHTAQRGGVEGAGLVRFAGEQAEWQHSGTRERATKMTVLADDITAGNRYQLQPGRFDWTSGTTFSPEQHQGRGPDEAAEPPPWRLVRFG